MTELISSCSRCGNDFKYVKIAKTRRTCDVCKRVNRLAGCVRRTKKYYERKASSVRPLIRYAGYEE